MFRFNSHFYAVPSKIIIIIITTLNFSVFVHILYMNIRIFQRVWRSLCNFYLDKFIFLLIACSSHYFQAETTASTEKTDATEERLTSRAQKVENISSSSSSESGTDSDEDSNNNKKSKSKKHLEKNRKKKLKSIEKKLENITSCTVKLRDISFKSSEEDVIAFFKPLFLEDIRFVMDKNGRPSGSAFVEFQSIDDVKLALQRDGKKMKGRNVKIFPKKQSEYDTARESAPKVSGKIQIWRIEMLVLFCCTEWPHCMWGFYTQVFMEWCDFEFFSTNLLL